MERNLQLQAYFVRSVTRVQGPVKKTTAHLRLEMLDLVLK
jgi:hypothetical protein